MHHCTYYRAPQSDIFFTFAIWFTTRETEPLYLALIPKDPEAFEVFERIDIIFNENTKKGKKLVKKKKQIMYKQI